MVELKHLRSLVQIDDDFFDQKMCRRLIQRAGLDVTLTVFSYAEEALAFLEQDEARTVDAIILDLNMPRMNGLEFLAAAEDVMGKRFAQAIIVMTTTALHSEMTRRALSYAPVKEFFVKPLTLEHLERIDRLIGEQASQQA